MDSAILLFMATDFDRLIERRNPENFSVEVGKETWEYIGRGFTKYKNRCGRLEQALKRCCDETDYCYVCDNHPSHGHSKDCVLNAAV